MTSNELFQGIDGPQLKQQRQLLSAIIDDGHAPTEDDLELLEGLRNLLDCVADVAHDEYGKDTLFLLSGFTNFYRCPCGEEWESKWDCQCNDKCPVCNKEIEPYRSEDAGGQP